MVSENYILERFAGHSVPEKVELLLKALDYMKEDNRRSKADCIGLALGIPQFPKVQAFEHEEPYRVRITFSNGEIRMIDFKVFFNPERGFEQELLEEYSLFREMEISEGTLTWPRVGILSRNGENEEIFYPYDIDPGVLYEHSTDVE